MLQEFCMKHWLAYSVAFRGNGAVYMSLYLIIRFPDLEMTNYTPSSIIFVTSHFYAKMLLHVRVNLENNHTH